MTRVAPCLLPTNTVYWRLYEQQCYEVPIWLIILYSDDTLALLIPCKCTRERALLDDGMPAAGGTLTK